MKYLDEITPLKLQPSSRKAYIPINFTNKRKNAAIILLSNNDITSFKMMNLDYIQNRGLYEAYYMDRNIGSYIGTDADIDDNTMDTINNAESMTEAVLHKNKSAEFNFIGGNQVDQRLIQNIYNDDTLKLWSKRFNTKSLDDRINVIIHPTLISLEDYLRGISIKEYKKFIVFSYSDHNNIHILSPYAYRKEIMDGPYDSYLLNELICYVINKTNPRFSPYMRNLIAIAYSGQYEYFSNNKTFVDDIDGSTMKFIGVLNRIMESKDFDSINSYIKDGKIRHIRKYIASSLLASISNVAENAVTEDNEDNVLSEATMYKSDYADILKIIGRLSDAEFKRISFHDTYQNSPFIVHRDILRTDVGDPVGFVDVYQFPSAPDSVQLTAAMDPNYRGYGYMKQLINNLIHSDLASKRGINQFIWTVHPDNIASIRVAESNGFMNTGKIDKYGRLVYVYNVDSTKEDIINQINSEVKNNINESGIIHSDEYTCITDNGHILGAYFDLNSLDEGAAVQDAKKMKKFLYNERIKNSREVMAIHNKAKEYSPWITKTYNKLELYKDFNLFIDTSYYHGLFFRNNTVRLDRGINLYFELLNKMINNNEYSRYTKKTIYIPLFKGIWAYDNEELIDYKRSINPISTILRLMRINPEWLKKEWGDKTIVFVGENGYFRVDFNEFKFSDLPKFKKLCEKVLSNQAISSSDLEDNDIIEPEDTNKEVDSKKVIVSKIVDRIEKSIGVTIDNISTGLSNVEAIENSDHLRIRDHNYDIENSDSSIVCILSPNDESAYEVNKQLIIKASGGVNTIHLVK